MEKRKPAVWKIFSIGLAIVHLAMVLVAFWAYAGSGSSTAAIVFSIFFFLDGPVMFLPEALVDIFGYLSPLILFGIFGTALWSFIPWLVHLLIRRLLPQAGRVVQVGLILVALPLMLSLFALLGSYAISQSVLDERPEELQALLDDDNDLEVRLKPLVVHTPESALPRITGLGAQHCGDFAENGLAVGLSNSVEFLDSTNRVVERLDLQRTDGLNGIEVMPVNGSCTALAYRIFANVSLYDLAGRLLWTYPSSTAAADEIGVAGVRHGDVDGDGSSEVAVFQSYGAGIDLLAGTGERIWSHPVPALGNVEMADVTGDGRAEIIYTNSNNGHGKTNFSVLDGSGLVLDDLVLATSSSAFAVVDWPEPAGHPSALVLTETNRIRVVDLQGRELRSLAAPGCRPFGEVKALSVRLSFTDPPYLAVRKRLHPDLVVLYVYDWQGNLVYQKAGVRGASTEPVLAVVQAADDKGRQRLLSIDDAGRIVEFILP